MRKLLSFGILLFLLFTIPAWSSVPGKLSYEGRLTDTAGNPITTAKTIEFKLYDSLTGGNVIWGPESHSVTPDSQGVFSAILGETVNMTAAVFNNATRYLELSVAGETLSPRSQIVASGYSFMSANSQGVEDGTITRAKAASGQFVKSIIAGSGVTVSGDEGSGTGNVTLTATGTGGGTGTVSQVNTGNGLTGGPITSTGTLAINTNIVVTTSDAQTLTNKTISGTNNSLTNLGISNLTIASQAQGDIVYFNGTSWTRLAAGTSGQLLKTNGVGA
ncbi:MAG: hypothetical protein WCV91_05145, partial [Candidatus Margulisiibacteriota bacterium]